MANRRDLVKRRKTVKNIRKITRTMQLIATARFQQAMTRASATRPYAERLAAMVRTASASVEGIDHPLLKPSTADKEILLVITSNRGLCGGYNGGVLRTAIAELRSLRTAGHDVDLHVIGKKGIGYFKFLGETMTERITSIDDRPTFDQAAHLADAMMDAYTSGQVAAVKVSYMQFISAGSQRPGIVQLLPLVTQDDGAAPDPGRERKIDFSPPPAELLAELLPASVRMRLFGCLTEAAASEQVARMVAMKAATDAAGDMIRVLTQQYNRARQTSITMELLDIVGGATAIQ